jgi:hypothetical protein
MAAPLEAIEITGVSGQMSDDSSPGRRAVS